MPLRRRVPAATCGLRRLFSPRSFAIRQHAASRVLDGPHLLVLLQQASGASNFAKAVTESNVKLEKEKESLRSVRTDVSQHGQTRYPGSGRAGHLRLEAPSRLRTTPLRAPAEQSYGLLGSAVSVVEPLCPRGVAQRVSFTALGARPSRLQSRRFHCVWQSRWRRWRRC